MLRVCAFVLGLTFTVAAPASAQSIADASNPTAPAPLPLLSCTQQVSKASAILCRTEPGVEVALNGEPIATADADGLAIVPIARNHEGLARISLANEAPVGVPLDPTKRAISVAVISRDDPVSRFTMRCGRISPQNPADERHASQAWLKKQDALKIFSEPVAPVGFVKPAEGRYSSPYGAVRTYVPDGDCEGRTSVHNGLDIAVPTGTPVLAPMAGTVILADPDLFYEGGCVFLDHGRGLISVMMHLSRIDVEPGEVIPQGEQLGLSGATGRVSGPHLHWAIKHRNVHSDDRGTDQWLDPRLLLDLSEDMIP